MSLQDTKWTHNNNSDFTGKVVKHNTLTGRVVVKLTNGRKIATRVGNLRTNWTECS